MKQVQKLKRVIQKVLKILLKMHMIDIQEILELNWKIKKRWIKLIEIDVVVEEIKPRKLIKIRRRSNNKIT